MVDYLQKAVLLNLGTIELYGSNDPYRREPRSPRKSRQPSGGKKRILSFRICINAELITSVNISTSVK